MGDECSLVFERFDVDITFDSAFPSRTARSAELFERAKLTIPGGAGSTARLPRNGWNPYPLFIEQGQGSRITDVDGNEYVDYLLGLGPDLSLIHI